uniref:Right handed beta helix domain-containing protein n=1 Tax=Amphimedon queenslandica TaxID=400682 RepID=A0A1X7T4V2_AMPQE
MELCLFLQWLFLSSIALSLGNGEVFFVHPNNDPSQCPNDTHCYGINEYADGIPYNFMNDSIYYFLPGVHNLNRSINIEWGSNLTFQGKGMMMEGPHTTVMESPVVIKCISNATIAFGNCNNLLLSNLTIKNCGNYLYRNPGLIISASSAVLSYMSLQEIQWTSVQLNDVSDIMVNHSSFYKNDHSIEAFYNYDSLFHSSLTVNKCNFTEQNRGLYLRLDQNNVFVDVKVTDAYLYKSNFDCIVVISTTSQYNIHVDKLVGIGCHQVFSLKHNSTSFVHRPFIAITDSLFSQSSWRALMFFWYGSAVGTFHLNSTTLDNNLGTFGSALLIATDELLDTKKLLILLYNLTFDSNGVLPNVAIKQSLAVTLGLLNCGNINISNCTFSNNRGSALGLVNTIVTFFGDNYFINNAGRKGGGIIFIITSYIYLSPDAYLSFINNHADVTGGAINIYQPAVYYAHGFSVALCFFQFLGTKNKTYFYFDNNTA